MQKEGYIGNFEFIEDGKSGIYKIQLKGAINDCKAVKPRYSVEKNDFAKWEKRYLPSKALGTLIITTSKGILTHKEAESLDTGGKIIAYVY
jgi:small subunit ribosomal protein S8